MIKRTALLLAVISACMVFSSCGEKEESTADGSSQAQVGPVGINDKNPYPYNKYKGVLLEDADFDVVKVRITDIEQDSEHHADIGDTVSFEYYDRIEDETRKISKYLLNDVYVKDAEVEIIFTVGDAEYTKDKDGDLFIRHAKRDSGWQIISEKQNNDIPIEYLDENGEQIYITKEEYEKLKESERLEVSTAKEIIKNNSDFDAIMAEFDKIQPSPDEILDTDASVLNFKIYQCSPTERITVFTGMQEIYYDTLNDNGNVHESEKLYGKE